jgi:hypothetical protein
MYSWTDRQLKDEQTYELLMAKEMNKHLEREREREREMD